MKAEEFTRQYRQKRREDHWLVFPQDYHTFEIYKLMEEYANHKLSEVLKELEEKKAIILKENEPKWLSENEKTAEYFQLSTYDKSISIVKEAME